MISTGLSRIPDAALHRFGAQGASVEQKSHALLWILIGAAANQKVSLGGEIFLGELLGLAFFLHALVKSGFGRADRLLLTMATLWSVVQAISDVANDTSIASMVKGVLAPLVFVVTIIGYFRAFRRDAGRIGWFLMGLVLSGLVTVIYDPSDYQKVNPWKWGYGPIAYSILAIAFSFFLVRGRIVVFMPLLTLLAAVSIYFNARTMAVLPVLGLLLFVGAKHKLIERLIGGLSGRLPVLVVALPLVAGLYAVSVLASGLAHSGLLAGVLPTEVYDKFAVQAGSKYGMILAGRSEWIISTRAFLDAPLLGHGSWAEDKSGYIADFIRLRYESGISERLEVVGEDVWWILIPSHSFLFGALVWSGIVGGIFWLYIVNSALVSYVRAIRYLPVYFHIGIVEFIWNVLFSPFGAGARWGTGIFLAALFAFSSACADKNRGVWS